MLEEVPLFLGLGIVGLTNLSLLAAITVLRTYAYISSQRELHTMHNYSSRKKVVLHVFLCLAVVVDLPMYISFIVLQDYYYLTYSFHKLQPVFLLAAYSITINDWSTVLYSIQEIKHLPLVFRTGFLVFVNAVFSVFSVVSFVIIIAVKDVDRYANTLTYKISIMLQISVSLVLTLFMLHSGLGLSRRLQGVSGMLSDGRSLSPRLSSGFKTALNRLIIVMLTCSICIFVQLTLMIINYAAGYADKKNKSPGPQMFYWTFYAWLPLWGPILAMLHLSRSRVNHANDYDTTRHGFGEASKAVAGMPQERDGSTERLLRHDELHDQLDGSGAHPGSHSLSHNSAMSRVSGRSAISSASSTRSGRPGVSASVYRPPDYPSSLFSKHQADSVHDSEGGGRSFDDSSCYYDGSSGHLHRGTVGSLLSAEESTASQQAMAEEFVEERGSSEDDYQNQYNNAISLDQEAHTLSLHAGLLRPSSASNKADEGD